MTGASSIGFVTIASLAASLVGAEQVLYEVQNAVGTVYYNIGDVTCPAYNLVNQLATSGCEQNGPTQEQLATNRIVAMNQTWMEGDKSAWCGKEVRVYMPDGSQVEFDEPLVLWDTCAECANQVRVDFDVSQYLKIDPVGCETNQEREQYQPGINPTGLTVRVMDNQIWAPAPGSDLYSPTSASTLYTGGVYNFPSSGVFSLNPWGTTVSRGTDGKGTVVKVAAGTTSSGTGDSLASTTGTTGYGSATTTNDAVAATTAATGSISAPTMTTPPSQTTMFATGAQSSSFISLQQAVAPEPGSSASLDSSSSESSVPSDVSSDENDQASTSSTSALDSDTPSALSSSDAIRITTTPASDSSDSSDSSPPTSSHIAGDMAATAASSTDITSSASGSDTGSATCSDGGKTYTAGIHICQGNQLMICGNTKSGSDDVEQLPW
nr:uncharacterized protein CI109_005092 [Kwoniella shandongensis]KAA5526520.1 hypothetical protein CI109_005092 [Kwoniella shandongensis]